MEPVVNAALATRHAIPAQTAYFQEQRMLINFSVSNFRSFATRQMLSLVANKRLGPAHESHVISIPDSEDSVLRAGVMFGPNGAGKSNLVAALKYVRAIALGRDDERRMHSTFMQPSAGTHLPSIFDLRFISAGTVYRY